MDANEIAGSILDKRIADLEAEVARLKQYEPKPFRLGLGGVLIVFVLGVLLGTWLTGSR